MDAPHDSARARWAALLAGVVVAFLAYLPALGNAFYNDDAIFLNHAERVLEQPSALLTERPLNYFRPVFCLYVTAQWAAFGLEPTGYYAIGILLHGLIGFLVWCLARRVLPEEPAAAWWSMLAFLTFYSHSEATLWIAAHNSSLVAGLALLSLLAHLRAVRTGRLHDALLTAALVYATLLTKEPGVVVLAWIPVTEAFLHGFRSCFRRVALLRYALIGAALVAYVLSNDRLLQAFAGAEQAQSQELRATGSHLAFERVIAAVSWLFSPFVHRHDAVNGWSGALLLLAFLGAVRWLRRDLFPIALLAVSLLVLALLPACITRQQQMNGARLYYFPTVGAGLMIGLLATLPRSPRLSPATARGFRVVGAAALVAYCAFGSSRIWAWNQRDFQRISTMQTRQAIQIGAYLPNDRPIFLLEPWLDNIMHIRQHLWLHHRLPEARIRRQQMSREDARSWLSLQLSLGERGAIVLDWDDEDGLVPAASLPTNRFSVQGKPRDADTGVRLGHVDMMVIRPDR